MPTASFSCPECSAVLRTNNRIPAGKKIKCPKCSAIFAVPGDEEEEVRASIQSPARPAGAVRKARPIEDEDEQPPPRPVRKAQPVDDYDDEPADDPEEDRPVRKAKGKGKKKLKKAKSGSSLMLGLIVGGALLVLLGGFSVAAWVWPGFLKGSSHGTGKEVPLAFLPADCNIVAGLDAEGLMADPTIAQLVNPLLAQAKNNPEIGRMKAETGLEFEDMLGRVVIGLKFGGGGMGQPGVAPPGMAGVPTVTIVLQTRKAFDPDKVGKATNNATAKKHSGKTYYAITSPGSSGFEYMPNDRLIVISTLPEAQFQSLLVGDGTKINLSGDMASLCDKVKDGHIWVAANVGDVMGGLMGGAPGGPGGAAGGPPTPKTVGVALKLQGDSLKLDSFLNFADEATAKQAASQLVTQLKGSIGMIGMMMPKAKNAINELTKNIQVSNDGPQARMSSEISRKSLEELLKGLQEGGGGLPWLPGGGMPGGGFQPPPNPGRGGRSGPGGR